MLVDWLESMQKCRTKPDSEYKIIVSALRRLILKSSGRVWLCHWCIHAVAMSSFPKYCFSEQTPIPTITHPTFNLINEHCPTPLLSSEPLLTSKLFRAFCKHHHCFSFTLITTITATAQGHYNQYSGIPLKFDAVIILPSQLITVLCLSRPPSSPTSQTEHQNH